MEDGAADVRHVAKHDDPTAHAIKRAAWVKPSFAFEDHPDPIAASEAMVEQLMAYLKHMSVADLAKLSKRVELRLHRKGRWIYLKDGRVSSQLELPSRKATSRRRPPCCLAVQPKAPF